MNEYEFRFLRFDGMSEKLKNKRIVLYGTGVNAKTIIEKYPHLEIIGIMEKKRSCSYLYGKKNLRMEELVALKVDVVIIASGIPPIKEIYNRICLFCHSNGIELYDMYGDDLFELFFLLTENQRTLCQRNESVLKETVEKYDIISVDLFQTLLNDKKGFEEEIWWRVAEKNKGIFEKPLEFIELRRKAGNLAKNKNLANDLEEVYDQLIPMLGINQEQGQIIKECEKACKIENLFLCSNLVQILKYAKSLGKEIILISDAYFTEKEIKKILCDMDMEIYGMVLSAADRGCTKISGLYREVERKGKKWLHIGENEITDGVSPLIYKIDIFLLRTADQLKGENPYAEIYKKITKWYEEGKTREMLQYGGSSLCEAIMRTELLDPFIYCHNSERSEDREKRIKSLPRLEFTEQKNPEVSIIIPVYNQFLFTYNCLSSILRNTQGISYEVIIADDCSKDLTVHLETVVTGTRVIRNKINMGFLKNCNNAARNARGRYILFLNNDTFVQPQWLSKLLSLINEKDDIGMVGSKLIYPDGRLQEAGGIVWEDASAWNFGYGDVAGAPVYNYVKEVDYISGAAIMIKADLWKEIGGFDNRYEPAYYEDTDLAFEVRKRGYKVMYHPFSTVVHFEGISNGTDVEEGLKAYQVANKEKFYEKWKNLLSKDHFKNGSNLFIAKDRSKNKKHILVVDHYVPQHDHDAGGRCTYMYLKAFVNMGMQVTFIGDNFAYSVPYSQELLEMGIEVLYGSYYKMHIREWMEQNLKFFDIVYLQRPHISIKYIDMVRELGRAQIFYFAHDLHHVRLSRQYELTGDKESLIEAEKWKKIELELFDKSDVGHVVGSFEQQYMQELYPEMPVRNIPLYIFERTYQKKQKDFSDRKDILYVGGFGHPPNIDAVLWFAAEVFPHVLENFPNMKWHVVGNKPTEEILALASDNIIIEGFVSDSKLEEFYNNCRLAVVPLRVGAGVKGKIIESAYYQLPVVTTDIGAEGISREEGALVVENDASKMAECICRLYEDYNELEKLAMCEKNLIERHYLIDNAMQVLKMDMHV